MIYKSIYEYSHTVTPDIDKNVKNKVESSELLFSLTNPKEIQFGEKGYKSFV